jgi:hypothetical protein
VSDVPRAITQIAVSSAAGQPDVLYALANDGTTWRLVMKLDYAMWFRLPDLPIGDAPPVLGTPTSAAI